MIIKFMKNKGFTLLEILVVIGIIMILVGMMSVSYSTAQKKARDAKRKSDLSSIQNAMEQYYSVCGYKYPTSIPNTIYCPSPSMAIMPTVPTDPQTLTPYSPTINPTIYNICATLETETAPYCVSNLQ